jgi:uncharacterized protein YjaZ
MRQRLVIVLFLSILKFNSIAQENFSNDPDSAKFITHDIDNFWNAFDRFKKDTSVNPFGKYYMDIGSDGVKGFTPNRIQSAEHLFAVVKTRTADYESTRNNSYRFKEKEKQCRSIFYALKYLYPEAKFPPVYFVMGAYNSGGTSNENGLFIGAEMQKKADDVPFIVAHELIHFQQKKLAVYPTLLQQSIVEGSADFVGEMISGVNINKTANDYGNLNAERLCKEFVERMDSTDYTDWLYGVSGKDDRPDDLGYWIGYKIVEQYFINAKDKKQAIKDILNIEDYKQFLNESGYLKKYL